MPSLRRIAAAVVTTAAAATALVAVSAPAHSVSLQSWSGTATTAADGDTVFVDVGGDHLPAIKIRNAGIQAMETAHVETGSGAECHANAARTRMGQLVNGKVVRLSAQSAAATSEGRPVRFIDVRTSSGAYLDTQLALVSEGHALWFPDFAGENSRSLSYHLAMEQAAARGANIWQSNYCGNGPYQEARLRMWINYDADGSDGTNLNGEYVRIQNNGPTSVDLGGWHLRDASHRLPFTFPSPTVVPPYEDVTVHTGSGHATSSDFYEGLTASQWPNLESSASVGDGSYLLDPQGDFRAHITYPCVSHCTDVRTGLIGISVHYDAAGDDATNLNDEYADIHTIRTTAPLDASRTVLEIGGRLMEIPNHTILSPGERLKIHTGRGTPDRLNLYWGNTTAMLSNSGGAVSLRNTQGSRLACTHWGTGGC